MQFIAAEIRSGVIIAQRVLRSDLSPLASQFNGMLIPITCLVGSQRVVPKSVVSAAKGRQLVREKRSDRIYAYTRENKWK